MGNEPFISKACQISQYVLAGIMSTMNISIPEAIKSFVKGLHYNLGRGDRIASAVLTDCDGLAPMLFIGPSGADESSPGPESGAAGDAPIWTWRRSGEPMPPLPLLRARAPRTALAG